MLASGKSIQGKVLDGTWTAAEHVANRSFDPSIPGGAFENSPWISTSKLKQVAESYDNGHGIIAIDLNKVPSLQAEVWRHVPRVNGVDGLPYHRSIWA
ncbi:hypothetical protein [Klebsiella aerogenes]|uniref:hypothetical protein n=1 Tax=Klebsiella aerogenes TaxID=548 RepID=UPI003983DBA9